MSYDFSLDKKKGFGLTLAFLSLAFLFFAAGWLTHAVMHPPGASDKGPGTESGGMRMRSATPTRSVPVGTPLQRPTMIDRVISSVRTVVSNPRALIGRGSSSAPQKPAPETPADEAETPSDQSETASEEKAADEQGGEEDKEKSKPDVLFSVEVESFVLEEKAKQMVNALKEKGYGACLLKMGTAEDKTWYVVQIGDYGDLKTAYEASSDFEKKEGKVAVIRTIKPHILEARKICE